MRSLWIAFVCLVAASMAGGCASQDVSADTAGGKPANQTFEIDEVKRRAKSITIGMPRQQVWLTLGNPAVKQDSRFVYLPSRTFTLVPAELYEVKFDNGRVVEHGTIIGIASEVGKE